MLPQLRKIARLFPWTHGCRVVPRILQIALALTALGVSGQAQATTVGCNGAPSGTYDFPTLTAAVAGAPLSNNTITIYGTCTEDVVINGAQNLTIVGATGALLNDAGLTNSNAGGVLEIDNSQNVSLQNLKIQMASYPFYGPFPGIAVNASALLIQQIDIEGSSGTDGIDINAMSNVQFLGANLIENNNDGQANGEGIDLTGPAASLTYGPGGPAGCLVIQGNGDDGILAESQASVNMLVNANHCLTVQNNGGFGVQISTGSSGHLANRSAAPVITLSGNLAGAAASLYGQLYLNGPMLIQNNSGAGVWLRDGSANFLPGPASASGPTIQQNGGGPLPGCCMIAGAVSIQGNSNLILQAGTITNNLAPGVNIEDASSATITTFGTLSITQNPVGISVANASSVFLNSAPSVTGNTNGDVVCSGFSVAHGDFSAVGRVHCDAVVPENGGHGNGHSHSSSR